MKYWRLYSSAGKEVGCVPQIIDPIFEGHYAASNQLWNVYREPLNSTIFIPKGHLQKRAKFTDIMSVGFLSNQLFLSDRLTEIMNRYLSKGIQYAKTEIITKSGEVISANIMHPYIVDYSFIDMNRTEFQISNVMGNQIIDVLKFSTYGDFLQSRHDIIHESKRYDDINLQKWISISKLFFKVEADFGICSVFDVVYGGVGFFVSQDLMEEVLGNRCTGAIFRDVNERYP